MEDNKNEKYFFEKSENLKLFLLIIYISSIINLHLCIISPPGFGKTTAIKSFAQIRAIILNKIIPYYINIYHSSTKPNDFYGSEILEDSEVFMKEGNLKWQTNIEHITAEN